MSRLHQQHYHGWTRSSGQGDQRRFPLSSSKDGERTDHSEERMHMDTKDDWRECCVVRRMESAASRDSSGGDDRDDKVMVDSTGQAEDCAYWHRDHGPLKRHQQLVEQAAGGTVREERTTKRRRVEELLHDAFYRCVPVLSEGQQTFLEYTAPAVYAPLFYWLGYSSFAIQWVVFMYLCHVVQTFLTDFGDANFTFFRSQVAPITPLNHLLIDSYVWNHPLFSIMLLCPHWFDATNTSNSYWLAVLFAVFQQIYVAVYLKTTYVHTAAKQTAVCLDTEWHLVDSLYWYAASVLFFVLARSFHPALSDLFLWIGLLVFNVAPFYLVRSHQSRLTTLLQKK